MSWASRRKTTRREDLAYCLLGLFDVNMPLLYGEGVKNAFLRLQTEILARSTDDSIFAWDVFEQLKRPNIKYPLFGMLAPSPRNFAQCGNIRFDRALTETHMRHPQTNVSIPTISSRGLELSLHASLYTNIHHKKLQGTVYPLSCRREGYGRIFVKIWIDEFTSSEKNYADGARLAWRSGCITTGNNYWPLKGFAPHESESICIEPHVQSKKLMLAFRGAYTPNILQLSSTERMVYDVMTSECLLGKFPRLKWIALLAERGYRQVTLNKDKKLRLYFKTKFEPYNTPDVTLLEGWI